MSGAIPVLVNLFATSGFSALMVPAKGSVTSPLLLAPPVPAGMVVTI